MADEAVLIVRGEGMMGGGAPGAPGGAGGQGGQGGAGGKGTGSGGARTASPWDWFSDLASSIGSIVPNLVNGLSAAAMGAFEGFSNLSKEQEKQREKAENFVPEVLPQWQHDAADALGQVLPAPEEGPSASLGAGPQLAAAGIAAAAAVQAFKLLTDAATSAVHGLGSFASAIVNPSDNPGQQIAAAGSAMEDFGGKLFYANPALGAFAQITGAATNELGKFMSTLDGLVGRYGQVNPAIATAQAQADVQNILGELRRGQEAAPALTEYIQARSQLQQKIEDEKIKLLNEMAPTLIEILEALNSSLPVIIGVAKGVAEAAGIPAVFGLLGAMAKGINAIAGNTKPREDPNLATQNHIRDLFAMAPEG